LRNVSEHDVIDLLVWGIAVFEFGKDGDISTRTKQGYDELVEIRTMVLAVSLGDFNGAGMVGILRIVLPEDTHGGGVVMDVLSGHAKNTQGVHGKLGIEMGRVGFIEAIEESPNVVVYKLFNINRLTQQQLDILVLIEAVDTLEGVASREGIEHHGQHQSTRGNLHPARHQPVDGVDKVNPVSIGFDDGKMVDIIDFDFFQLEHGVSPALDEFTTNLRTHSHAREAILSSLSD
jgi:hypothetical protein